MEVFECVYGVNVKILENIRILKRWKSENFSHHTQEPQNDVEDLRLGEQVLSKFNTR